MTFGGKGLGAVTLILTTSPGSSSIEESRAVLPKHATVSYLIHLSMIVLSNRLVFDRVPYSGYISRV